MFKRIAKQVNLRLTGFKRKRRQRPPKMRSGEPFCSGFKAVRFNSRTTLFLLSDVKSIERAGATIAGQEIAGR
jgi:hypothetical protein